MKSKPQFTPGPWKAYGENVCAKLASDTRSEIIATTDRGQFIYRRRIIPG